MIQTGLRPTPLPLLQSDFEAFSRALMDSFREYGFAVVSEHGLPDAVTRDAIAAATAFFALPEADKRRLHVPGQGGARGYTPFGIETAKGATKRDLKEFWHVGRELPEGHPFARVMPPNVWPERPAGFREATLGLYDALDALGGRLLEAAAHGLGLERGWFEDKTRLGNSVLRLAHYPPVPADAEGVRAAAHEDINVITLLLGAEEAGLEVLTREGRWLPINPKPGSLVVNVGDMLQRLTNHVLPSTTHRVVNPAPERQGFSRLSTPFFLHFEPDFEIRTLESCVKPGQPNRYPEPISADAYLQQRLHEIGLKRETAPA